VNPTNGEAMGKMMGKNDGKNDGTMIEHQEK
jgi:hypothetical protein